MRTKYYLLPAALIAFAACTKDIDVLESTTTSLGPNGGEAKSADGRLTISVPRGALNSNILVVIETDRTVHVADQLSVGYKVEPSVVVLHEVGISFDIDEDADIVEIALDRDEVNAELASTVNEAITRVTATASQLHPARYAARRHPHPNPHCGNGTCGGNETCSNCPQDCGTCPPACGDGMCTTTSSAAESCATCPADCGPCGTGCGDGQCTTTSSAAIENCATCPQDCGQCPHGCGDGMCTTTSSASPENCQTCPDDCGPCASGCGDGMCTTTSSAAPENCMTCPSDCGPCTTPFCGDGMCTTTSSIAESCATCPGDCGPC